MGLDSDVEYKGPEQSIYGKVVTAARNLVIKPVEWFRENVVEPNRPEYYWYHERLRRVPTIDECYEDDFVCQEEANEQFSRDRQVDSNILIILKRRYDMCMRDHKDDPERCEQLREYLNNASTNFHIKYGDMTFTAKALDCYMKQKHRMAWERRHGPIKSSSKSEEGSN